MKNIFILILLIACSTQLVSAEVCTLKDSDGKVIKEFIVSAECPVRYIQGYDTYIDGVLMPSYSPQKLMLWAMQTYPDLVGTTHESALSSFAMSPKYNKDLFIMRSQLMDEKESTTIYSVMASQIINKASEMGVEL